MRAHRGKEWAGQDTLAIELRYLAETGAFGPGDRNYLGRRRAAPAVADDNVIGIGRLLAEINGGAIELIGTVNIGRWRRTGADAKDCQQDGHDDRSRSAG